LPFLTSGSTILATNNHPRRSSDYAEGLQFYTIPLVLGLSIMAHSQSVPLTPDPSEIVRRASEKLRASDSERLHYAYSIEEDGSTFDFRGRRVSHHKSEQQVLFVSERQYVRSVTLDGTPLPSTRVEELREETATHVARWATGGDQQTVATADRIPDGLLSNYSNRVSGYEKLDGINCVVVEFSPLPGKSEQGAKKLLHLWIDATSFNVLQFVVRHIATNVAKP
jgi:hypothetical protein